VYGEHACPPVPAPERETRERSAPIGIIARLREHTRRADDRESAYPILPEWSLRPHFIARRGSALKALVPRRLTSGPEYVRTGRDLVP